MPIFLLLGAALVGLLLYERSKHPALPPHGGPIPGPGPQPGPVPNVVPTVYGDTPIFTTGGTNLLDGHAYYVDIFRQGAFSDGTPYDASTFADADVEGFLDAHFFQNGAGDYHSFGVDSSDPRYWIVNFVAVGNTTAGTGGLPYAIHDQGVAPGGQTAASNPDAGGGGYPAAEGSAGPSGGGAGGGAPLVFGQGGGTAASPSGFQSWFLPRAIAFQRTSGRHGDDPE
jgi:hypothetical protein